MNIHTPNTNSRALRQLFFILCLLLFFGLALSTAGAKSATADESVHISRASALYQTRDLRIQTQPPLAHWFSGSLLLGEPTLPKITEMPLWEQADRPSLSRQFLWQSGADVERIVFLARVPIIFLALLFGCVLARWAYFLTRSYTAQSLTLFLFALSPNLIGLAAVATTDMATIATYPLAVIALWAYHRRPTRRTWLLAGVALALALAAKITNLAVLPLALILLYGDWRPGRSLREPAVRWAALLPVTALCFWALYQFEVRFVPEFGFALPAATYIDQFLHVTQHLEESHPAFLLGQTSHEGWWTYFFVAFFVKTPVPTLILTGAALVYLLSRRARHPDIFFLWFPAVVLFVAAAITRLNIGYRHIMPLLPFVWVMAAMAATTWLNHRLFRVGLALLLGWYGLGTLLQHPDYLAYFNTLAGGSERGYLYLGDSNIDWGQDLNALAAYVQEAQPPVYYSYFGASDPTYYGLPGSEWLPADFAPANPAPGTYALSVNHLQGMVLQEWDRFDWFRRRQPQGSLGHSILLYDVPTAAAGSWIAHCLNPGPLLEPDEAAQLVGQTDARHLYFDCRQGWVFPQGGTPGWYVLPQQADLWPMAQAFPEALTHVYKHSASVLAPSYDVYYWDGTDPLPTLTASPQQATTPAGKPVTLPAPAGDLARLWGYSPEEDGSWHTVWQVQNATGAPLSVAAHFYGDTGTPHVADGLAFATSWWQPGDIFVQTHLPDPALDVTYLATGLYNYLDGDPIPFALTPAVEQLHLYAPAGNG